MQNEANKDVNKIVKKGCKFMLTIKALFWLKKVINKKKIIKAKIEKYKSSLIPGTDVNQ